jgi:hypothetical protein
VQSGLGIPIVIAKPLYSRYGLYISVASHIVMKISFLYLLLILAPADKLFSQQMEKVRDYLSATYPKRDTIYERDLVYNDSPIKQIQTPLLTTKTGTVIYKTELGTGYYEYNLLTIAVAVTTDNKIEILKSPTFTETNETFLSLLKDFCIDKEENKIELTKEIGNVFKEITYDGLLVNVRLTDNGTTCDLKHGRLYWRELNFRFEGKCLRMIEVEKSKSFTK